MNVVRHRSEVGMGAESTWRGAVVRFALLGVLAVLVVAVAAGLASEALAEQEALRDAASRAEGMARGLAVPFVSASVREGDAAALQRLDEVMHARISEGGVTHVVLWSPDGRVLWADAPGHAGDTYPLSDGAEQAIRTLSTVAQLPSEGSAHASDFYPEHDQLEIYVGAVGRDGEPFAFEAYMPPDRIAVDRAAVLPKLLGVSLGSLVLFFLAAAPLALSLARRVDEAQRQRTAALSRSVSTWHHQRRLLAQELHDGVIQDLAALGYGLSVLAARPPTDQTAALVVARLRGSAEHAEASLRSLVLDLTPRQLAGDGLAAAVADLADRYGDDGIEVVIHESGELDAPEGTGILAFRVLREGLRNVAKHTDARHVRIWLRPDATGALAVEVHDDGSIPVRPGALGSGQGLRLLADTLADAGGSLDLAAAPDGGTRLLAVVPPLRAEPGRP